MLAAILLQAASIGTADSLAAEPTRELSARTYAVPPPGIVSHKVRSDASLPRSYSVEFFTAAEQFGQGLCRRRVYYVSNTQVGSGTAPTIEQAQLALADDCASVTAAHFAWVRPADAIGDAAIAVRWLADRQSRGGSTGIRCLRSQYKPDPCTSGGAATLRALPLDRIFIVNRGNRPGEWDLSVMPRGPGQLFYDVQLSRDRNGVAVVTIQWNAPAPF